MFIAADRKSVTLKLSIINVLVQMLFAYFGAKAGLEALGLAIVLASAILSMLWLQVAFVVFKFSRHHFMRAQLKSLYVTALALLAPALTIVWFGSRPAEPFMPLLLSSLGMAGGFIYATYLFQHPLWNEIKPIFIKKARAINFG